MSCKERLARRIERMWWSAATPPLLLRLLASGYAAVNRANLASRQQRAIDPPLPLISVGNITAGGSGKTPFVIWLAGQLRQRGYRPVILCRGDGGSLQQPCRLDDDTPASLAGDEAVLLHRQSGCPVIAGRDRVAGARMAASLGDLILLDDGFQYRQLRRSCDIVLVPAEGIGNGKLIPAGPLRETPAALARADLIVRSGSGRQPVQPVQPHREWQWWTEGGALSDLMGLQQPPPAEVMAVAGIARPERFVRSLEQQSIRIRETRFHPDHHPFSPADVEAMLSAGLPIAVTAKDAVKLQPIWPVHVPLWVMELAGHAETGLVEAIVERLASGNSGSR